MRWAGWTTAPTDGWFRQEKSTFKAVAQVGVRGWRGLEPILLYLEGVTNKSYFITLTTMAGPTGANKIALEREIKVYKKKTHETKQARSWGRKRR